MTAWSRIKYQRFARGYEGAYNHCLKRMINRVQKGLTKAYKDRRRKRRLIRREWILSINAAVREHQISYSRFVYGLNRSNIKLDRKVLSDLAIYEPYSFKAVVDEVKIQAHLAFHNSVAKPFTYYQALAEGNLVFGDVKPRPKKKNVLPFLKERTDIDPKYKGQFVIDENEYAFDRKDEWKWKQNS